MTKQTRPPTPAQHTSDEAVRRCPYVGLMPFGEEDAAYFFGRKRESDLIVANLDASRLTLLYASSGVGKSSVLQAGVLPRLHRIAEETYEDLGIPGAAVAYVSSWRDAPLESIAAKISAAVSRVPGTGAVEQATGAPELNVAWLREVLRQSRVSAIYLIFDQFEEYLLYHSEDREEAGLTAELGSILSDPDLPVNVLLSIREDAVAGLDRFKDQVPRLFDNYLRLTHLSRDAAQTAIEGPRDRYNQVIPSDQRMSIEPSLTVTLLDQVRTGQLRVAVEETTPDGFAAERAGSHDRESIETPFLQLVLTRLWYMERDAGSSCLRQSTLELMGGAEKIVQSHLDSVMGELSPKQRDVAAAVFRDLVRPSGAKIALTAQDLADAAKQPVSEVQNVLDALCAGPRRILRPLPPADGAAGHRYEIFNDVMGSAVRAWRRYEQAEASRRLIEEAEAAARAARKRLRRTRFIAVVMAVMLLSVGATFVFNNLYTRDSPGVLVQTLVTMLTVGAGAVAWWWTRARPAARLPLEQAADELAKQLRQQWEQPAAEQGLTLALIPVRWRWSSRQVTGPMAEAVGGLGGRRFAPLPGMAAVTMENLRLGTVKDLFRVYGGLGSGRLIVLGEPGAGKSGAGIRLLRDALDHRAALTAEDRARVPVPVMVTPHGWDPIAEPFVEWLADRLARDYGLLRAPEYGGDAAVRLIEGGHLAVILDGLDEMPEALRSVALRALDEQVAFRLVVLARSAELVAAVGGGHLRGAAALELLPIGPGQAAEYLASFQVDPLPPRWQRLIGHLREYPDSVLAQTLSTPLMLTLVRDIYGSGEGVHEPIDVDELINVGNSRFGSREAIEDYLLDRVLTAAYVLHPGRPAPPYTVDQARRWLGHLARRMNEEGTRDLTWWRIPRWVPAWPRAFATVVVMSVISTFLIVPLAGLVFHMHLLSAVRGGPLTALEAIFAKALGFGFMFGLGLLLISPPGGGSPQQRNRLRWSRTDILAILSLALGVGVVVGLEYGLAGGLKYWLAAGLMSSFVVGLGFILGGGPPQQLGWLRWSKTDTRTNLLTGLVVGLVSGLVVGLVYGLVYGLKYGLAPGFTVGIGYMCVIVLGGRSSPRRDQSLWSRTDIPTTLLIGLAIAIASSAGYGIIYVLIVILGGRPPLQRSRPRWSRTTTPATLLTGLMAGLVFGLVFGLTHRLGSLSMPGLVLGLVFGLTVGLLLGLRQPSTEATSPLDPQPLWRRERQSGLVVGFVIGFVVGLVGGLADGLEAGLVVGLVVGLVGGLVVGLVGGLVVGLGSGLVSSATWEAALASAQLRRRGEAPVRLLRFLDDARQRQILRTVGPVYQFRDARLQDRLADACETLPGKAPDTHVDYPSFSS